MTATKASPQTKVQSGKAKELSEEATQRVSQLLTEGPIPLKEAAKELAETLQHPIDMSTLHRWARNGCSGVRLEVVRLGRDVFTSRPALTRFLVRRSS